jgi:hypothetical protein
MRTLRMSLAGTVILMALGGLSSMVMAQEDPGTADWVIGTDADCAVVQGPEATTDGALSSYRGMGLACTAEMSDPRLSGPASKTYNEDCYDEWPCVYWGTHEIAGPDGTWVGAYTGTFDPGQQANGYFAYSGTEAYDGLAFVGRAYGAFGAPATVEGIVYEGSPPPLALPAE